MYSYCNAQGYNSLTQNALPHTWIKQLPTAYPQVANELSALAHRVKDSNLNIQQVLIEVKSKIGTISDPKVAAGLRGAAAILQEAIHRPDQELSREYAGDLINLSASFLATVKKKN